MFMHRAVIVWMPEPQVTEHGPNERWHSYTGQGGPGTVHMELNEVHLPEARLPAGASAKTEGGHK